MGLPMDSIPQKQRTLERKESSSLKYQIRAKDSPFPCVFPMGRKKALYKSIRPQRA